MSSRRRIRAPAEDGTLVVDPPLSEVGALLHPPRPNRLHLLGRPLGDLQSQARQTALDAARAYLKRQGEPIPQGSDSGPLLLAGHQPELFHPGVWVKNFALQGLARAQGGVALNLVVDNDIVKSTQLRLPHPPTEEHALPFLVRVPFDRWISETPYEEWTIQEPALFGSFAERAGAVMRGWGFQPLLTRFWQDVCCQAERNPQPGSCFTSARRSLERHWGCHNLELPLSDLCQGDVFAWFACDLLARLPLFHGIYNRTVAEHRRANRIRSRNHPVPDLTTEGDFLEAPLWGWRAGKARRSRLMVRVRADQLELRAGGETWPELPLPEEGRMGRVLDAWQGLQSAGFRIRTRALSTTLFTRLLLADLFLHGIGGGKYDELTDSIALRFYEQELPHYMVLSATKLLPLPAYSVTDQDRHSLLRDVRDVRYNPERFLDGLAAETMQLLVAKKRTCQNQTTHTPAERRERYWQMRALNDRLRKPLGAKEQKLRQLLAVCERELASNALLRRRDYAFCLYPEAVLRPFCTQLLNLEAPTK